MNEHPKPLTVSQMFPDKWLCSSDLKEKSWTFAITAVTVEQIYDKTEKKKLWKTVLDFGRSKRMILNVTQCRQLWRISGTETFSEWSGLTIQIAPTLAPNGKKTISISAATQPTTAAPIVNNGDDEEE